MNSSSRSYQRCISQNFNKTPKDKSEKKKLRPYSSHDSRRMRSQEVTRRSSQHQLSQELDNKNKYSQQEYFKELNKSLTNSNLKPRRMWIDLNDIRKNDEVFLFF